MAIIQFTGINRFLSNFYPQEITWRGITFPSNENAYQADKSSDEAVRQCFAKDGIFNTPWQAKKQGRLLQLRPNWEQEKVSLMADLVEVKFNVPELEKRLLDTRNEELIEGNHWHDNFWGRCYCPRCIQVFGDLRGRNLLGELLVACRTRKFIGLAQKSTK